MEKELMYISPSKGFAENPKRLRYISSFFNFWRTPIIPFFPVSNNPLKTSALYFCSFEPVSKRVGNYFKRVGTGTKTRPEW